MWEKRQKMDKIRACPENGISAEESKRGIVRDARTTLIPPFRPSYIVIDSDRTINLTNKQTNRTQLHTV